MDKFRLLLYVLLFEVEKKMIERLLHFIVYGQYKGNLTVLLMQSRQSGYFYLDVVNPAHQIVRIATKVNEESFDSNFIKKNLVTGNSEDLIDALLENAEEVWIKKKWYKFFEPVTDLKTSMLKLVKEKYKKTEM